MTWKRELAFWAFMLIFCFLLMWSLIDVGTFLTENQVVFSGVVL